jgi:hypothetical protein
MYIRMYIEKLPPPPYLWTSLAIYTKLNPKSSPIHDKMTVTHTFVIHDSVYSKRSALFIFTIHTCMHTAHSWIVMQTGPRHLTCADSASAI